MGKLEAAYETIKRLEAIKVKRENSIEVCLDFIEEMGLLDRYKAYAQHADTSIDLSEIG